MGIEKAETILSRIVDKVTVAAFVDKYKSALIFLGCILIISIILVLIYQALKREMCNCMTGSSKRSEDEESLYTGDERDDDNNSFKDHMMMVERLNNLNNKPAPLSPTSEQLKPIGSKESLLTESNFKPTNKKRDFIKFTLKKVKGKSKKQNNNSNGRVRFANSENACLVETENNKYGSTLRPLKRADSMESFESGVSTITSTVEEFGDELSPSRLQVFIKYDPKTWLLVMGAKQGDCLISTQKEKMYWQVHVTLMPFKKHKFKTRYKSTSTPVFNQNYNIENVPAQSLAQMSVRYRVYGKMGHSGRKKMAGETEVELTHILKMKDHLIKDWRVLRRHSDQYVEHRKESLV